METLLEILFTFAIIGGMAYVVAQMSRDREIGFWTLFAVSAFFTPFVGVIVGLLSKRKRSPEEIRHQEQPEPDQDKFWSRFMPGKDGQDENATPPPPAPKNRKNDRAIRTD